MAVNILCIGDVVGKPGRKVLADLLPDLIVQRQVDAVICNAENAAGGSGLTPQIYAKLLRYGVDAITMGDHVFRKRDILGTLANSDRIVRPGNLSAAAVGRTWTVVNTKDNRHRVGVFSLLGQMYMGQNDSPWAAADRLMREIPADVLIRVLDFHAEASSEKIAMGWHLNGRASIVFGTHTHIPTADACVLDQGTAFIADVGMTGPYDGVLGRRKDRVLSALTTHMPCLFEIARGDPRLSGILVAVNPENGKALSIERVELRGQAIDGSVYDSDDGRP